MSAVPGEPTLVLLHGGALDRRCYDLLLPHLPAETVAVDLPGRGANPADILEVGFADCAAAVVTALDVAGVDRAVLVGHSLAGAVIPAVLDACGDRIERVVLVAATVPPPGHSVVDTLDVEIQDLARAGGYETPFVMSAEIAQLVFGTELTAAQLQWCIDRLVPESPRLNLDPVDPSPYRRVPVRWVRTLQDVIVPPDRQARFASGIPACEVVDIEAGHMCMVTDPEQLAGLLR